MLGLGLGLGLVLGLRSSRDDIDDHLRRLQPIDLNSDMLGITYLNHESGVIEKLECILIVLSYIVDEWEPIMC